MSWQKHFYHIVAITTCRENLKKNCYLDSLTFEAGELTIDKIFKSLEV